MSKNIDINEMLKEKGISLEEAEKIFSRMKPDYTLADKLTAPYEYKEKGK